MSVKSKKSTSRKVTKTEALLALQQIDQKVKVVQKYVNENVGGFQSLFEATEGNRKMAMVAELAYFARLVQKTINTEEEKK
jgi:hypothetical protein